jgi:hypothetical protein
MVAPIWAADVSRALTGPWPAQLVASEPPSLEVFHGAKRETIKSR